MLAALSALQQQLYMHLFEFLILMCNNMQLEAPQGLHFLSINHLRGKYCYQQTVSLFSQLCRATYLLFVFKNGMLVIMCVVS
jgi:hypothetical protein